MHVVLVQMTVKAGFEEEFEQALLENARLSLKNDPGCLRFDVSRGKDDPLLWVIHEVYDREESHAAHRRAPHFLAFKAVADRAVAARIATRCEGRHIG